MPRLSKGGKWVYRWVVVGPQREIAIPSEAYREYGFQAGDPVIFLPGSRRSGGFSVGRRVRLEQAAVLQKRALGQGRIESSNQVSVPPEADVQPGERLLAVRGSGYAMLFLAREKTQGQLTAGV